MEATFVLVSFEEAHITLLADAFPLPLDFLLVTVVHYWLLMKSGWTHMISHWGVGTGTILFSFLLWGSVLITLSSPFGMGTTLVGANGRTLSNWRGVKDVIMAVTFFCSGRSSASAFIRARGHSWRCSNSLWVWASCGTSSSWGHVSCPSFQDTLPLVPWACCFCEAT